MTPEDTKTNYGLMLALTVLAIAAFIAVVVLA
jgi:hypothetical protein